MIIREHRTYLGAFLIAAILGAGCAKSGFFARSENTRAMPKKSASPRMAAAPDSDLRLFGQSPTALDVAFEGKAAANLEQHTTPGEGADFDPNVDPTGHNLVFASTRHSRYSHLYVKATEGAACTQLTDENANDSQPVFSPDGKRIAFASDRGGQWDIWVMDADGRNPMQITSSPMPELHPSWSPDSKRLVYCRVNPREGRGELWISPLDNPGVKRLIGEGLFPSWSPKGDKIAYQRARARGSRWFSIWTLQLEKDDALFPTEIASSPQAAFIAPTWSADGSQIAFASVLPGQAIEHEDPRLSGQGSSDIGVVDSDGRGLLLLTSGSHENYSPHWASDGRIYFASRRSEAEAIWSLRPLRPGMGNEMAVPPAGRQAAQVIRTDEP